MKKYNNLDGLRTFSAIGIILMHIMTNTNYQLSQNILTGIIGKAGLLVELFFMISAFGMCCGYYERIKNGTISLDSFFNKRYLKILPFFAFLVCVDVVLSGFKFSSLIEGFSDLTLMYGFFPNPNISVIGVGWALGVIFAFYILFPFCVFMLWNKRRGWFFLAISLIINYVCRFYFNDYNCNIAKWLCYFVAGGMLYLYREQIEKIVGKFRIVSLIAVIGISVGWYMTPSKIYLFWGELDIATLKLLMLFASWMCYAISVKSAILANPFTEFMSSISFEIYLSHMVIFRAVEKLKLLHLAESDTLSYGITCILVLMIVTVFATVMKKIIDKIIEIMRGISNGGKEA